MCCQKHLTLRACIEFKSAEITNININSIEEFACLEHDSQFGYWCQGGIASWGKLWTGLEIAISLSWYLWPHSAILLKSVHAFQQAKNWLPVFQYECLPGGTTPYTFLSFSLQSM